MNRREPIREGLHVKAVSEGFLHSADQPSPAHRIAFTTHQPLSYIYYNKDVLLLQYNRNQRQPTIRA